MRWLPILAAVGLAACAGKMGDVKTAVETEVTFDSSFEHYVAVGDPFIAGDGLWRQYLTGRDSISGDLWLDPQLNSDLPGAGTTSFRYRVDQNSTLGDFIETTRDIREKHDGSYRRVLTQRVLKDDPADSDVTRSAFIIFADDDRVISRGYWSLRWRFQPNLLDVHTSAWREMTDIQDFRKRRAVNVQVVRSGAKMIWRMLGKPCVGDCPSDWTVDNTTVAVPAGEWFLFEQAFQPGYVGFKVNGAIIAERNEDYVLAAGEFRPFSCYAPAAIINANPIWQELSDFHLELGPSSFPSDW